jgi:hypothetical protein
MSVYIPAKVEFNYYENNTIHYYKIEGNTLYYSIGNNPHKLDGYWYSAETYMCILNAGEQSNSMKRCFLAYFKYNEGVKINILYYDVIDFIDFITNFAAIDIIKAFQGYLPFSYTNNTVEAANSYMIEYIFNNSKDINTIFLANETSMSINSNLIANSPKNIIAQSPIVLTISL